jgi:hypothetical protein
MKMTGTIAAESAVDVLQSLDQITHEVSGCLSACSLTEMRAAAEGARVVNLTQPVFEEWASAVG